MRVVASHGRAVLPFDFLDTINFETRCFLNQVLYGQSTWHNRPQKVLHGLYLTKTWCSRAICFYPGVINP